MASRVLLASVVKALSGAVFLYLEDLFEVEGEDILGFEVGKIGVEI